MYAMIPAASSSISSETGSNVAILRTGSETSSNASVDSGLAAASAVASAALVAVDSLTYLTGVPGACFVGIRSAT